MLKGAFTRSSLFVKRSVKGTITGAEIKTLGEPASFGCAKLAFHPAVFPLDAERPFVTDNIESTNDLFEVHTAATGASEVPTTTWVAKVQVTGQNTAATVECLYRVFDVYVVDAIRERSDELYWIDSLPDQVARIKVESELFTMAQRLKSSLGGIDIERNLGRVHFQRELDTTLTEHIQNWIEPIRKLLETGFDHRLRNRRERVQHGPNTRSSETVDDAHAKLLCRASSLL